MYECISLTSSSLSADLCPGIKASAGKGLSSARPKCFTYFSCFSLEKEIVKLNDVRTSQQSNFVIHFGRGWHIEVQNLRRPSKTSRLKLKS